MHCSSKGRLENWCRWDTGASRSEVLPKCWLSVHQCQTEIEIVTEEKERGAVLLYQAKGKHSRLSTSRTVPPSLVSRERLYSQAGECHKIQGSNSLVFFLLQSFKRMELLTRLVCVQDLRVLSWYLSR